MTKMKEGVRSNNRVIITEYREEGFKPVEIFIRIIVVFLALAVTTISFLLTADFFGGIGPDCCPGDTCSIVATEAEGELLCAQGKACEWGDPLVHWYKIPSPLGTTIVCHRCVSEYVGSQNGVGLEEADTNPSITSASLKVSELAPNL